MAKTSRLPVTSGGDDQMRIATGSRPPSRALGIHRVTGLGNRQRMPRLGPVIAHLFSVRGPRRREHGEATRWVLGLRELTNEDKVKWNQHAFCVAPWVE